MSGLMDLHVYTNNSMGAKDKISLLCETAVEKGLRAVAFTDSIEMDRFEMFECRRRLRHSFFDAAKARRLFQDNLSVFSGIEFRQAVLKQEEAERILASQSYDIVLSSITRDADGQEFFAGPDTASDALERMISAYADILLRTVEETDFDVLSGVLKPFRHCTQDLHFLEERLKKVLTSLAQTGKALELNSKNLQGSDAIRDLCFRLMLSFREAGGKYITVGSGSRFHEEIGQGIDQALLAVKRAGFSSVTFYEQRFPYQVLV